MHTVALSNTGEVWTWGVNDEGALGRKTLGTAWEAYPDEEKADEKVPGRAVLPDGVRMVESLITLLYAPSHPKEEAVKLVAGARHCAILTKNGTVLTWGIGGQGQLGRLPAFDAHSTPPVSELFVPKPVDPHTISIRSTSIATIASGAYSTFVISKSGDVVAWGLNNSCQLAINKGDEQNNIVWEPTKENGSAWLWGSQVNYQLAKGDTDEVGSVL
ncbi:regulator of chromosome condensation 1/beta-lactamase-inhibitor protein II [Dunaliella salina]|uniref:Regulator of chromosome condensation 1/beta-lactamase-inhibitor protein II n=1 Tax=Dunaliella salina TaxID=3046 RepID=A0ABQ7H1D7_DUNSA|nr:regulator of chromosome condensation 1/beta-lactamase-inhibitor protein II [Dunaliella salina]|eukprot:KAF5840674.1 regulator of chromosome condensation 1/beta-lactamase-inhibitor protein II [Dunaliella salina]